MELLIHSVCSLTSVIIPSLVSLSSSALYASCMATGTDLGGMLNWSVLFLQSNVVWAPGNVPIPLKTSLYSFNMYSFVMGSLCTLPFSSMESSFHLILGITGSSVWTVFLALPCLTHSSGLVAPLVWCPHSFGPVAPLVWCPSRSLICSLVEFQECVSLLYKLFIK